MSSVRRTGPPARDTTSRFSLSAGGVRRPEQWRADSRDRRSRALPGTVLARHAEHILKYVQVASQRLASGGMKRRVFTTYSRWISSAKAEIPDVQVFLRLRNEVGGWAELIIYSAEVPQVIGTAMICRVSERRRSNRSGQKYHSI